MMAHCRDSLLSTASPNGYIRNFLQNLLRRYESGDWPQLSGIAKVIV